MLIHLQCCILFLVPHFPVLHFQRPHTGVYMARRHHTLPRQRTSDMSARHLRSAATPTLVVPSTRRSTLGDRAFPVATARVRNSLPSSCEQSSHWRRSGAAWKRNCLSPPSPRPNCLHPTVLLHYQHACFQFNFVQCPRNGYCCLTSSCSCLIIIITIRKPSWRWQTLATQKHAKIAPIRRVSFHFIEFHFPEYQITDA